MKYYSTGMILMEAARLAIYQGVLPAFVKGMSYDNMEIGNGGAAMEAYHQMCDLAGNPKELARIQKNLLEYCKQDTLAMVKLLEVIVEKAGK